MASTDRVVESMRDSPGGTRTGETSPAPVVHKHRAFFCLFGFLFVRLFICRGKNDEI
jgi:hypothetical protein